MKNTFRFKKKYGQNFLISKYFINKIVNLTDINNENILEIGPGNLSLTKEIISHNPKKFVTVEIDKDVIDHNTIKNNQLKKFILNGDARKFNEIDFFKNNSFKIISNLPFNISNDLLLKWVKLQNKKKCIKEMVLMFQKELGERIIAKENNKKYGRLSILVQAVFSLKMEIIVKKEHFYPKPKVDAIVIKFTPHQKNKIAEINFVNLEKITNFFFNSRRKKNLKKIKKLFSLNQIKDNNFERLYNLRPENIPKEIFYKMSNLL